MSRTGSEGAWRAAGAEKRKAVRVLFGEIAANYDRVNSALSLRLHHRWRAEAVRLLKLLPGDAVADVCCGTGDFGAPLRRAIRPSGRIVGIDFCEPMLRVAREKRAPMALGLGDACAVPLATAAFDAVTVGWGLRNVEDLERALVEIRRVLKPGGRFASVDMAKPKNAIVRAISRTVLSTVAPAVGAIFGNKAAYKYLPKSTDRFASRDEQADAMCRAGFADVQHKDLFFGNICIHWGRA